MTWESRPYLIANAFAAAAGMEVRDLPTRGKLSALIFEACWNGAALTNNVCNLFEALQLIEIIHRGSEVIKSLTGEQHAGVAWRRGAEQPMTWMMTQPNGTHRIQIVIPFGRYPYDREYGLTLDNLVNPQIRFTWNIAYPTIAMVGNDGGFDAIVGNEGDWSIRLIYAPEDTPFRGYIKTSRIDQYATPAGGGNHYTEMPKNYKWPRIYVHEWHITSNLMLNCDQYELQADNMAWVPVTIDQHEIQRLDTAEFGRPELWRYMNHMVNAQSFVPSLFDEPWESMCETQGGVGATCCNLAQGIFNPVIQWISSGVTVETKLIERGKGFGSMYAIPLVPSNQEAEIESQALDSRDWGRLMFRMHDTAACEVGAIRTVILEELITGM